MVYLAELLVVTTVWLKIVRIIARNVPRTRTKAPRRRRSRPSVAAGKQRCRVLDEPGCRPVETQNIISGQPVNVWQWPLSTKTAVTVCRLHFDTKSEQSDCNKSSVR